MVYFILALILCFTHYAAFCLGTAAERFNRALDDLDDEHDSDDFCEYCNKPVPHTHYPSEK